MTFENLQQLMVKMCYIGAAGPIGTGRLRGRPGPLQRSTRGPLWPLQPLRRRRWGQLTSKGCHGCQVVGE